MSKVTKEDVLKLAQLSKIELNPGEIEKLQSELSSLIEYIDVLQSVDTNGLSPTNQVGGLTNVMREDEIKLGVSPEELLKNAPGVEAGQIKVRRVIE